MFGALVRYVVAWIPFLGRFLSPPATNKGVEEDLPPARVAIIGAGIGGCFSAKFLRELGGKDLDIHVWNKPDSSVGGRTATIPFAGHSFEAGASVAHSSNEYLVTAAKENSLKTKGELNPTVPVGIYNGKTFVFRTGTCTIVNLLKSLWHFGLGLIKMTFSVKNVLKKFSTIYTHQQNGECYATVPEMLKAMGGEEMSSLTQVSARDHFTKLGWPSKLIDQLITGAMRVNYGQTTSVNAFCTYVSLAGMEDGSLWSVVGGNWQIAEKVLQGSKATFHKEDVLTVTRVASCGKIQYKITSEKGNSGELFDVVILANPLNTSAINFNDFPSAIYTSATTSPYQRTVSEFVQGRINKSFFNVSDNDKKFPQVIITTEMTGAPFDFRSLAVEIPSETPQERVSDFLRTSGEEPIRVWKIFTPKPLSADEKKQLFVEIADEATVDWLAYPKYHPPEQSPPFILDDGMFYINAIEKAASAMEMSAIGAKNVALLAREYLLKRSDK